MWFYEPGSARPIGGRDKACAVTNHPFGTARIKSVGELYDQGRAILCQGQSLAGWLTAIRVSFPANRS